MLKSIFSSFLGIVAGWIFYRITVYLISKKSEDNEKIKEIKNKKSLCLYLGLSLIGIELITIMIQNPTARYELMLLFSICLSIGWVDGIIRKIPNEWLLTLILSKVIFLLINHQIGFLIQGLIGLAAGFFIFMLPSMLGISIGAGDVKYAAVIGFYLGVLNLFQVILIMALGLLGYLLYLTITKKGGWKTAAAMGPYISFGVMITALFPLR